MTDLEQLYHNLTNHPPLDAIVISKFENIRLIAKRFGEEILVKCPPCRERSLALTNLEQTVMWAVAAIARNQAPDGDT